MIAGSSTGSILAAALVCPSTENKTQPAYYADTVLKLFKEQGPVIYKKIGMSGIVIALLVMLATGLGGIFGFRYGKSLFADPQMDL